MASRESVVNIALRNIGEELTETLDPSIARSAVRKVLAFLDDARDMVLIAHDWLDARGYETLQPTGAAGSFRWPGLYWLPNGALVVRDVDGCVAWERGTEVDSATGAARLVIRADTATAALDVTFTRRIDWAVIPVWLEQAMGLQLAAMAGPSVNGDWTMATKNGDRAAAAIALAQGKDGVQTRERYPLIPDPYGVLRRSAN
ncbi:hypothetical protein [Caulobacter sp. BK020]|uniref:hypothetical protein n=1 Tax=Caulobacter sp. BK020 TaxID=2512117 RepID=UPI00104E3764|nr:hypothetical protein [Caulobacter sp. BK020]TCS14546.1 hypothetical protein EV278_107195 [Caulobacter sp. BK020]